RGVDLRDPGAVRGRADRDERPAGVGESGLGAGREVEEGRAPARVADLDEDRAGVERVRIRALDLAARIVDEPRHRPGPDVAAADADVRGHLGGDEDASVGQPACPGLHRVAEIEELTVLLPVNVDEVDLAPRWMTVGAPVENPSSRGIESGRRLVRL